MENTNVTCDVCSCAYNQNGCTCNLDAIKITEPHPHSSVHFDC